MTVEQPTRAPCPKCRGELTYVTAMPHPNVPEMRKITFVCYSCNRTFSYVLSPEMAAAYAPAAAEAITA